MMPLADGLAIPEMINSSYMRGENVIRRARAAHPDVAPENLGTLTGYPTSTVRSALGLDQEDEQAAEAPSRPRHGNRRRKITAVSPAGTTIKPWEVESFEREKKRKAAADKHYAWLIKKGIKVVSAEEDTPPRRARAAGWRERGTA